MVDDDERVRWLEAFAKAQGAIAGTVHEVRGDLMFLVAAFNIPRRMQEVMRVQQKGKGMSGLSWLEDRPISTCSKKMTNGSPAEVKPPNVRPAATLPVRDASGAVRAIIGLAFPDDTMLDDAELGAIRAAADALP